MYEEMKMAEFPQTFKDAIWITRRLGIKYLWIDSLCIIQQPEEKMEAESPGYLHEKDWSEESVKMQSYYGNAYLTLSPLDSKDSHTSMLPHRKEENIVQLGSCGITLGPFRQLWHEIFAEAILNTRGWVFQERLLSTRVLHLSQSEFLWECNSSSTMEGRKWERIGEERLGRDHPRHAEHALLKRSLGWLQTIHALHQWPSILQLYLRRQMTAPTDWLPGLSGVAEHFQRVGDFTYIAGVWQEDPTTLLWQTHSDPQNEKTSVDGAFEKYIAPTWSCKFGCIPKPPYLFIHYVDKLLERPSAGLYDLEQLQIALEPF
jgi:hypothetical protein